MPEVRRRSWGRKQSITSFMNEFQNEHGGRRTPQRHQVVPRERNRHSSGAATSGKDDHNGNPTATNPSCSNHSPTFHFTSNASPQRPVPPNPFSPGYSLRNTYDAPNPFANPFAQNPFPPNPFPPNPCAPNPFPPNLFAPNPYAPGSFMPKNGHQFANGHGDENASNQNAQADEENRKNIKSTTDKRSTQDVTAARRQFDIIWDPDHNCDLTVHLPMDVHEDLDDFLEEFWRLQRLGDFDSAQRYFEEHLGDHFNDPYVLLQYGEMLLERGDYLGISKLGSLNQRQQVGQESESEREERWLLDDYWDLILFFADCHYIPHRRQRPLFIYHNMLELLGKIVISNKRDITSTEVKYLALLYTFCGLRDPAFDKRELIEDIYNTFSLEFHEKLYGSLLRQGRIWDLRDIIVGRMVTGSPFKISAAWSTHFDFRVRLHDLVADWTNSSVDNDTSTLLALLDILTSLVCWDEPSDVSSDILTVATPIARTIIDHNPEAMNTRPFIQWMLAQCECAELGSHDQLWSQEDHLDISPGIPYRPTRRHLVQYAPYESETPNWVCKNGPVELQNAARMAVRTAKRLGDYRTQAKALQLLILISANPANEYEELGSLQKHQGDKRYLAETLAARYLVSHDELSRQKLRDELTNQWFIAVFLDNLSPHHIWILFRIKYALARDIVEADRARSDAETYLKKSPPEFIEYVNTKMPQLGAFQEDQESRTGRSGSIPMRSNRRYASSSPRRESSPGQPLKEDDYGRLQARFSQPTTESRPAPKPTILYNTGYNPVSMNYMTGSSIDSHESSRERHQSNDAKEGTSAPASQQQPPVAGQSGLGSLPLTPKPSTTAGRPSQNTKNAPGPRSTQNHDDHPQAEPAPRTSDRASDADRLALVPVSRNFYHEPEEINHGDKDTTTHRKEPLKMKGSAKITFADAEGRADSNIEPPSRGKCSQNGRDIHIR
ncbi:hypothetical protein GGS21DRAFT_326625 [Xylaria nigripes]|nr:hypothetical protein GGS21DRAFT_326625 [Xylaria nigripes]